MKKKPWPSRFSTKTKSSEAATPPCPASASIPLTHRAVLHILSPVGLPTIGAVAQLGERHVRNVEVRGSIPLGSTNLSPSTKEPLNFFDARKHARRQPQTGERKQRPLIALNHQNRYSIKAGVGWSFENNFSLITQGLFGGASAVCLSALWLCPANQTRGVIQ